MATWRAIITGVALIGLTAVAAPARADIFKLKSGGEVRGELSNPDQSPRTDYDIRPFAGGQVKLAAALVASVVPQRPIEAEYEKLKLTLGDSVDDQWKLAEWCHKNNLDTQRKPHLERIIALDPSHAEARRLLGYEKVGDRWLTRDEIMQQKGYVKFRGRWVLPQEVELSKQREDDKRVQKEWFAKLKQWRIWLDGDKAGAARRNLLEIKDKAADKPLIARLKDEKDYRVREIYAESLSNLGTPDAVKTLVEDSINDPKDSFREWCLDLIGKTKPPAALGMYVKGLSSRNNEEVNRAAQGLGRLGDPAAIGPLIEALVTKHKFIIGSGDAGQISPTFSRGPNGTGGAGLSSGGPKVVYRQLRNQDVLASLVKLSGQDFDYNIDAWKSWHAAQRKKEQPPANVRRD
ncbi:MAG: hypothetical protein K8T25_16125 [Planctomycetia bacterium]|nr:hypothetical protein [Planctomycetia bacterium]